MSFLKLSKPFFHLIIFTNRKKSVKNGSTSYW